MAELETGMSHAAIAAHLRHEVMETSRFETGRLIQHERGMSESLPGPAFFGAVRAVMCDVDYVAALYDGWDGLNRRHLATRRKTVRFLSEVFADATGEPSYTRFAEHLYNIYRSGTVHLRAPKRLRNPDASTPMLAWTVMTTRETNGPGKQTVGPYTFRHLEPWRAEAPVVTTLPVSIEALHEDFLSACEHYASLVEREAADGGVDLRDRWRSTADAMVDLEDTDLDW
jgi:hypothetical protein